MKITFDRIGFSSTKIGMCTQCGKRRKRTKRFEQTLNPFNKNKDGLPKTEFEIQIENSEACSKWRYEPFICATCEGMNG